MFGNNRSVNRSRRCAALPSAQPLTNHIMITITAKHNALESFSGATDWMASFLDFQINKLEERSEDIPAEMDAKLGKTNQEPMWN
ncbi:MAG TPA: hypothetical protein VLK27_12990 [Chthoniobacterales bacterium]|nr:hypothetical protein [Chthoniobacterales bacterium]